MKQFVIVGGGVAAVCCAEELCRCRPEDAVVLVSAHRLLKGVSTVSKLTRHAEELKVEEKDFDALPYPNLRWVQAVAVGVDTEGRRLLLADGDALPYDKLCICTGASPKKLPVGYPHVLTLRDTESVQALCARLPAARRVMVVGNGGIALELIHALKGIEVVWVMRHGHIGDAFFDLDAAKFLLEEMQAEREQEAGRERGGPVACDNAKAAEQQDVQVQQSEPRAEEERRDALGHAVGPTWASRLPTWQRDTARSITLEYGCQLQSIDAAPRGADGEHPVTVALSNGHQHGVDFVVSAIGVTPAVDWVPAQVRRASDGGLAVDGTMLTSVEGVYAAGDSCTVGWASEASPHWFQMRLWSQARATGVYAAHCVAGVQAQTGSDMAFELFTHVTRFMGRKVVLLGLYNGQRLDHEPAEDIVTYCRIGEGEHGDRTFVRVLLLRGRVQGAVLIGETELEETFENLILDALDVGQYGPALLDPDVELDALFD